MQIFILILIWLLFFKIKQDDQIVIYIFAIISFEVAYFLQCKVQIINI